MEVDATSPAIGSHVQFVSVPEEGVPRTGLVRVGLVRVLFVRVSVVARPTYVSVPWNVIVVASVPAKVRVLLTVRLFPVARTAHRYKYDHDAAVVPLVRIHLKYARVPGARIRIAFAHEEFTVTAPVLLLYTSN